MSACDFKWRGYSTDDSVKRHVTALFRRNDLCGIKGKIALQNFGFKSLIRDGSRKLKGEEVPFKLDLKLFLA